MPMVPSGKRAVASAIWPFSTRVKRSFISAVAVPTMMVRVTSVVPSGYCAPESSRKISSRLILRLLDRVTR